VDADRIIEVLELVPHPEGGHYRQTWRDADVDGRRGHGSAIWYLLRSGERAHWHRVDAVEVWHWYSGAALELVVSVDGQALERTVLGPDLEAGERPQAIVPAWAWQAARSLGEYTLAGCTVAPAFSFATWELAPPAWAPGQRGTLQ
jgi:predicted cupin superfamily sugar epimerase